MTILEIKLELKKGNKITHKYFSEGEFVCLINDVLIDEMGTVMNSNFWTARMCGNWDSGWSLFY